MGARRTRLVPGVSGSPEESDLVRATQLRSTVSFRAPNREEPSGLGTRESTADDDR